MRKDGGAMVSVLEQLALVVRALATAIGMFVPQPEQPTPTPPPPPAQTQPAEAKPAAPAQPAPEGAFKTADELLAALEKADVGLKTLQADIRWDLMKNPEIAGDRFIRQGRLTYADGSAPGASELGVPGGGRKFALAVTMEQIGSRVEQSEQSLREYVFDGRWFVERDRKAKQFIKREVVPPDKTFDPTKLGEGPFPLPIGQKRDEIVKRYDVTLLPSDAELEGNDPADKPSLDDFVKGSQQLKLVPKPEIKMNEELQEIRLWYRPTADTAGQTKLLPRMARTVNRGGDISIIQMVNVELNRPVKGEVLNTEVPSGDWDVTVVPMDQPDR